LTSKTEKKIIPLGVGVQINHLKNRNLQVEINLMTQKVVAIYYYVKV
jgi:hypothetical protein